MKISHFFFNVADLNCLNFQKCDQAKQSLTEKVKNLQVEIETEIFWKYDHSK